MVRRALHIIVCANIAFVKTCALGETKSTFNEFPPPHPIPEGPSSPLDESSFDRVLAYSCPKEYDDTSWRLGHSPETDNIYEHVPPPNRRCHRPLGTSFAPGLPTHSSAKVIAYRPRRIAPDPSVGRHEYICFIISATERSGVVRRGLRDRSLVSGPGSRSPGAPGRTNGLQID